MQAGSGGGVCDMRNRPDKPVCVLYCTRPCDTPNMPSKIITKTAACVQLLSDHLEMSKLKILAKPYRVAPLAFKHPLWWKYENAQILIRGLLLPSKLGSKETK